MLPQGSADSCRANRADWLVWGNSWGVTLGLAYAQRHPTRVSEMVLAAVTMTRPADIHWLYHEAGRFFPEEWHRFCAGVAEAERNGDLVAAYYRLLNEEPDVAGANGPRVTGVRGRTPSCRWRRAGHPTRAMPTRRSA